ncbi:MAG: hypothetical protein LLF94_03165 [Chlamydiales bacterium]|nr:hypothetical protein [Chlamydiales bacterium]
MHVLSTGTTSSACYLYKKAEKYYDPVYTLFINIYGLGTALNEVLPIPKPIQQCYTALGSIGIADAFFVGPRIYSNISNIFEEIKPIQNGLLAICEVSGAIWVAVEIVQLVKSFGLLAATTLSWTNSIDWAFLPSKVMTFGQNMQSTISLYELQQKLTPLYIQNHPQKIRSRLTLSKKCPLNNYQFIQSRLQLHLAFALCDSLSSGASTLLSITSFKFTNRYLTATAYVTIAISQIALTILRSKYLPKNPTTLI